MQLKDYQFELPQELIAHYPAANRSDSRLLHMQRSTGELQHLQFRDLPSLLTGNDLLVFNNTRVVPARLFGHKPSGGKLELMIERVMSDNQVLAQMRSNHPLAINAQILFPGPDGTVVTAHITGREEGFYLVQFDPDLDLMQFLDSAGHMPLPPYIKRADEPVDRERYQTVYAAVKGAVAAPTAGLHFDEALLKQLKELDVETAEVTLHVGAGTFQPVRVDNIEEHRMHAEYLEVSEAVCAKISACRARGGRVVAVGTTTVRCLETACSSGTIEPYKGDTRIFIYPGYQFRIVDALITNFHLSESTLLMLVSAFSHRDLIMHAYAEAVKQRYRFFSYGDAMFIS